MKFNKKENRTINSKEKMYVDLFLYKPSQEVLDSFKTPEQIATEKRKKENENPINFIKNMINSDAIK